MGRIEKYDVGQLILFKPKYEIRDKSLPKGFYIVIAYSFKYMLLCPIPKTEMLTQPNGKYITYVYSGARSLHIQPSLIHLRVDETLIPKQFKKLIYENAEQHQKFL